MMPDHGQKLCVGIPAQCGRDAGGPSVRAARSFAVSAGLTDANQQFALR